LRCQNRQHPVWAGSGQNRFKAPYHASWPWVINFIAYVCRKGFQYGCVIVSCVRTGSMRLPCPMFWMKGRDELSVHRMSATGERLLASIIHLWSLGRRETQGELYANLAARQ